MRTRALFAGGLLLALLAAAVAGAASARTDPDVDTAGASRIDLATYNAKRWIVQLEGKPLARYPSVKRGITFAGMSRPAKIDLKAAVNRRYLSRLGRVQSGFAARLRRAIRGVRVERSYRLTLNALAVRMNKVQAAKVRRMKGVRAVTPDIPYRPLMYATPAQIGAPALWDQLGGQTNAGRGIKVAIIDSGVYVTKDAAGNYAGNPCFNDAGYTMPPGYPKGDTRFTNEKVIVARAYFRPDDPPVAGDDTPIPGPEGSSHGTHVGGTVACNAGTSAVSQGATVTLSGVAPAAYLMNYRIFYPSTSPDPFQNGNGYVAEIVQAIEDAVRDGADVLSNSWGSSHQNTLDWPDPMVEAAEAAVDAGVVGVWAQGNSGPATATGNLPSASPKVISVGAVSKGQTISPGTLDVTTAGAPANLRGMDVGPAGYGPQITTTFGPAPYAPASGGTNLACAPLPAGTLAGKIAVVQRGVCEFSTKSLNAQNAGAIATLIYNSAANGDNLQPAGAGVDAPHVTTPTWFLRRSDGLNMLAFAAANPGAEAQFTYGPHVARNIGDVVAGFSSRGPTQDKLVKPDVVAPGVDVLSGGYATAPFPGVFTGFGPQNGTSMATPHVAGAAALVLHRHPWWTPAMVKSALMTTASENVFLNTGLTARAGVLDRGAGRIDLSQAADPGLVVDHPSLSGRQMSPGQVKTFTVRARNISEADDTWDVSTTETGTAATTANFNLTVDDPTLEVERFDRERLAVTVEAVNTASPGNYEGSVVLVSRATGKRLHIPVWLQVVPAVQKDVLLIDDDGSPGAGPDHRSTYTALLDALGFSYDVFGFETAFPSAVALHRYRSIIVFTGENSSFNTSGFFAADHDALAEYLDSGGRLWAIGRNWALTEDSGSFHSRLDRGRLTSGYLGLAFETDSVYGTNPTPQPTATGLGPFAGMTLGISHGSIDAYTPSPNTDTYNAPHTTNAFFRQIGGSAPAGSAISFGRSSEPSLEEERLEYLYRSLSMGFGLEGLASGPTPAQLGARAMDWLLDSVSVDVRASTSRKKKKRVTFTATPVSSVGASFTQYRWDFGDGSGFVTTTGPTVTHTYRNRRKHEVRVEVTDSLGHRAIGSTVVPVKRGHRDDDDD